MSPNVAQHVGREMVLATMSDSNAENVNSRLKSAGVTNPDGTDVIEEDCK